MGREDSVNPAYDLYAYITLNKDRYLGGKPLTLLAANEEEQKAMAIDIAKALKAEITQLKCGDYMIIKT